MMIKLFLLWFSWRVEYPWAWWWLFWHEWRIDWCLQRARQDMPQQLLVMPELPDSEISNHFWIPELFLSRVFGKAIFWSIIRSKNGSDHFNTNKMEKRRHTDFWNFLISLKATVPGLNLCGFFTPPCTGAVFLAALFAICFLGCFAPVFFLAVCFVLAIFFFSLFWF